MYSFRGAVSLFSSLPSRISLLPQRQLSSAAARLSFGAASGFSYRVAAATVCLTEQDTVEPQASKGRWWRP